MRVSPWSIVALGSLLCLGKVALTSLDIVLLAVGVTVVLPLGTSAWPDLQVLVRKRDDVVRSMLLTEMAPMSSP
jgi:hypothetical protein